MQVAVIARQIEQADMFLRAGKVVEARTALQPGVDAKNGEVIAELGRTYDPAEMQEYLVPAGSTDAARAAELYGQAIVLGSEIAKARLGRLHAFVLQQKLRSP